MNNIGNTSTMSQTTSTPRDAIHVERRNDCYCCPYGGMHALPGILSGIALFFTLAVTGGCTFLSVTGSIPIEEVLNITTTNSAITGKVGAGIWFFQDLNAVGTDPTTCVEYPKAFPTDTAFQFTRFFSTLSFFGGITLFVMLMIAACRDFSKTKYLMVVAAGFFGLSLISMLHLILLASDICTEASECEIGGNAKLVIITSLLWILSGASTAMMKRKPSHQDSSLEMTHAAYPANSQSAAHSSEDRRTALTESDQDEEPVVFNNHNLT